MGFDNLEIANQIIVEIVKKKYGYLNAEDLEKKKSEVYTEIVSFLLYNYVKGLDVEGKERVRKLKTELNKDDLVLKLLEEVTSKKEILESILKKYSEEYIK